MNTELLLEVLSDQKLELEVYARQKLCHRAEEDCINLDSKLAQVVIGVRRSGKSTLCYNALSKAGVAFAYANFDDERLGDATASDLNEVLRCLYQIYGRFTHLFIDEVQNVDGWHLFVNRLLRQGVKVVVTGSNAKLLSSELSTHLTGRYHEIRLFPFSFAEYCLMKGVDTESATTQADGLLRAAFDAYLHQGGFPELVCQQENAEAYIDVLTRNIINRDIIQRFNIRYREAFTVLANHLLNNSPCTVSYLGLKHDFHFKSDHTVENYVGYLYQAYLLLQLNKYSNKSIVRLRESKCYAVDVAFMDGRKESFAKENLGWRLETIVYIELLRRLQPRQDVYYYSERTYEADFIVCRGAIPETIIQVCYDISSEKTLRREVAGLLGASRATGCDELLLLTGYAEKEIERDGKKISVRPIYKWLLDRYYKCR